MADEEIEKEEEESEDVSAPEGNVKRKILIYLIPAIILIGIAVGSVVIFFTKVNNNVPQNYDIITQKNADGSGETSTVFYTFPEITANLRTSSGVFEQIRIKLNIELSSVDDIQSITVLTPRINDIIISHLVELTPEEVSGSEGFYALKNELLHRINLIISPVSLLNLNITSLDIQITDALEKQED